jgi:hypothetical protein
VSDTLLSLFFFMLGVAVLVSGYRAVIALLPHPAHAMPHRVAAHLIILFWALATLGFVAWYLIDLRLAPAS